MLPHEKEKKDSFRSPDLNNQGLIEHLVHCHLKTPHRRKKNLSNHSCQFIHSPRALLSICWSYCLTESLSVFGRETKGTWQRLHTLICCVRYKKRYLKWIHLNTLTGAGKGSVEKGKLFLNSSLGDFGICTSNHRWLLLFLLICLCLSGLDCTWWQWAERWQFADAHKEIIAGMNGCCIVRLCWVYLGYSQGVLAVVGWKAQGHLSGIWWQFNLCSLNAFIHRYLDSLHTQAQ